MFETILENVKAKAPFVHSITNYVTVNDCANMILACGASPIMADDIREVEEITSLCNSLVINLGTLNERTVEAMVAAGKKANELGHPVILDPVGAGASQLRTKTALRLLQEVEVDVIRGNASEIKCISKGTASTKGVDADQADKVTEDNLEAAVKAAKQLAGRTKAIIVITGVIDIVADATKAYVLRNGTPVMSRITGTGCMLSAVIGSICAANPDNLLEAAAAGVAMMGICGEQAYEKMTARQEGTASFRVHLIDAMGCMDGERLNQAVRLEVM
ncbi:MAG TPA: hydroxyethylthiazole kinase [Clostridiales bacterium]|nr:hydroxyethylthiazole kinase [Clostridiales bacterium]